jgi:fructose-1,6-bisphosphatase I
MSGRPADISPASDLGRALADAPPGLADVIGAVAAAGRTIARLVQRARIEDVVGAAGGSNVHDEAQQKLDVIANDELIRLLSACPSVAVCGSEEEEEARVVRPASQGGRYAVLFDPLDGSSNIDVGVGVGTIFSVLPNACADDRTADSLLQPGSQQVASGYMLYGSQVALVLAMASGVDMFVLDPESDAFVQVLSRIEVPSGKKIYSINEGYTRLFSEGVKAYLAAGHVDGYTARYIGSMVADVHRTLLKGGVFLYPAMTTHPNGKIRLLYEANPLGFVIERAGGLASDGHGPILEVPAEGIHQRTPVILGAADEVERVLRHLA